MVKQKTIIIEISVSELDNDGEIKKVVTEKFNNNDLIFWSKGMPNKSDIEKLIAWLANQILMRTLGDDPRGIIFIRAQKPEEGGQNILAGKNLTMEEIKKRLNKKEWRYVVIKGGSQSYSSALRLNGNGRTVLTDSGEGTTEFQLVGIDSVEFTEIKQAAF